MFDPDQMAFAQVRDPHSGRYVSNGGDKSPEYSSALDTLHADDRKVSHVALASNPEGRDFLEATSMYVGGRPHYIRRATDGRPGALPQDSKHADILTSAIDSHGKTQSELFRGIRVKPGGMPFKEGQIVKTPLASTTSDKTASARFSKHISILGPTEGINMRILGAKALPIHNVSYHGVREKEFLVRGNLKVVNILTRKEGKRTVHDVTFRAV